MVSSTQLLTYGSLVAVAIAFVAARWSQWAELEAAVDDFAAQLFEYLKTDAVAFALPAAYARWVLPAPWAKPEPWPVKVLAAGALGTVALISLTGARRAAAEGTFQVSDFANLFVLHIGSYSVAPLLAREWLPLISVVVIVLVLLTGLHTEMVLETVQAVTALFAAYVAHDRFGLRWHSFLLVGVGGAVLVPYLASVFKSLPYLASVFKSLLPFHELVAAYHTVEGIVGTRRFEEEVCELLVVTAYVQVSLGYVGIWYMRHGQARTNLLLDVADGKLEAWSFLQHVGEYMWAVAAPYMMQRTIMETANALSLYAFLCKVDQHVRVDTFFSGGDFAYNRLEVALESDHTVEAYAESVTELMSDCYSIIEKKLFGFPNILLMSDTLLRQPALMMAVLPVSIGLDFGRARAFAILTSNIERLTKHLRTRMSRRKKIEEHDVKHAETISRTGSASLVASRWEDLAGEIFQLTAWRKCLVSSRLYLNWIYYQNIVGVGIECAMARMMELGSISAADLGVYASVIEDSIDFLLTRYREDARLAQMSTNQERLLELHTRLATFRQRLQESRGSATDGYCTFRSDEGNLMFKDLTYHRNGTARVKLDLELKQGKVYAVTGPNGAGKSTLFAMLSACAQRMPLPSGLMVEGSMVMPLGELAEVPQRPYHPFHVQPLAWLLNEASLAALSSEELDRHEARAVQVSARLGFKSSQESDAQGLTTEELRQERKDWYSDLSGGQRSKAELMRQIFLKSRCPQVVLIDEALAPLDPISKQLVQQQLKDFCSESLILVIYHTGDGVNCVNSTGFFDDNLHFADGRAKLVGLC
ncbi:pstB2 [Symbiodinium natans]|uniref:PstB2 protein n=1 Tax=Symbiodinium natans TaxID=878477 RepID=A0A812LET5_9DINO|nr:pstB2 [Symbiodinium natans]